MRRPTVGCGLDGWLRLSYNDRIEAEYREVLARPHFAISPARREAFLAELRNQDTVVAEPWADKMPPDMVFLSFWLFVDWFEVWKTIERTKRVADKSRSSALELGKSEPYRFSVISFHLFVLS